MDERVFRVQFGEPIPTWDGVHRLPISGHVGPECKDSATVHRINSAYMDISEQPQMLRHWLAGGIQTAILFSSICLLFSIALMAGHFPRVTGTPRYFNALMCFGFGIGFLYFACKFGRDEMFSLTRRPIRFNRLEKKIFALRRRRFLSPAEKGDITWEIPWDDEAFFCIHKGPRNSEHANTYHIRCYQVDEAGNVVRGFAMGREWKDLDGLNDLLCQWNYWCQYMNEGPSNLPQPLLFLTEKEDLFESFLYCMYEEGFALSANQRIILLPFIAWMTFHRVVALWTCREPIWPPEVEKLSVVEDNDVYRQPAGVTPIGWAKTAQAHQTQVYPLDPRQPTLHWSGEPDGFKNAELWRAEVAPGNQY